MLVKLALLFSIYWVDRRAIISSPNNSELLARLVGGARFISLLRLMVPPVASICPFISSGLYTCIWSFDG
jgi:hypothetical protein